MKWQQFELTCSAETKMKVSFIIYLFIIIIINI